MGNSGRPTGSLQFSLRALLLLMTVSALACGVLFAAPLNVAIPIVGISFLVLAPTVLISVVIYGSGYLRTFAIGALIPIGLLTQGYFPYVLYMFADPDFGDESILTRLIVAACIGGGLVVLAMNGGVAMLVRWLLERRKNSAEAEPQVRQPESPFDAQETIE